MSGYMKIWEPVLQAFERVHPEFIGRIVDWYPSAKCEITVKIDNGSIYTYNLIGDVTRSVKKGENWDIDDEEWKSDFAQQLTNKLRSSGIPQWELARKTGLSEVSISNYLNGKAIPSTLNLRKITRVLGCSTSELTDYID